MPSITPDSYMTSNLAQFNDDPFDTRVVVNLSDQQFAEWREWQSEQSVKWKTTDTFTATDLETGTRVRIVYNVKISSARVVEVIA